MESHGPTRRTTDRAVSPVPDDSGVYHEDMDFRVLGPIEVVQDGIPVSLGGTKQRTVLALLLASSGRPVSTDRLIEGVYGDAAPDGVRRSIQTFVSNLRSLCCDTIERRGDGYVLTVHRVAVDALRFEDAVAMAPFDEDPDQAAESLREALALWRGYPYADIDAHGLLEAEVARLNEMRITALGSRIDADLSAGRHVAIAPELASLSGEYPLREHFRAQHMVALYRSGRQAEALRACNMTRSYLADEIGIELSEELRDLEQRILDQDPSLAYQSSAEVLRIAVVAADIADPSSLSRLDPEERRNVVELQERIINDAAVERSGRVFAHRGSAIYASFPTVQSAVDAAAIIQQDLAKANLSGARIGIAIDIGDVEVRDDGDVVGPPVTRTSALVGAAHGGQVLLSAEAHQALTADGAAGWMIRGLGQHHFEGLGAPQVIYQIVLPGHTAEFPELRSDAPPAPLPRSARGIPGYELRTEMGSGPLGVVHRAYQSSVGREVAVKIIQPLWANHPEFLRRFEVEAQLVARLEHPHIVPLYDYWRDPSGAFLVMRWMRGGTLEDRCDDGALSLADTETLLSQIGPALAAAHRTGVVHGDIKPTNVLFDEEGNAYLSDFGIALGFHSRADSHGQPMANSINDEEPSVRGDVAGLGLLLSRCLGSAAPSEVSEVLARSMPMDPAERYADVDEFMAAWESAIGATDADAVLDRRTDARNPYKGLRPFDEPDADDFYGRERLIAHLADAIQASRLVAAIGPSGIGKSSVVKAGLIPALRRGVIPGSDDWLITTMTPGCDPFGELAVALTRVSVFPTVDLEETLRSGPLSLMRSVHRLLPPDTSLLLVVDQFEELFTSVDSEADRSAFLGLLVETASTEDGMIRVLLTMRADYMDRPLRYAEFSALVSEGVVLISTPCETELRAIVEEPARAVGIRFESGLVGRIVGDVEGQPGGLPLLEFCLAELFDRRDADLLTLSAYEKSGGVLETIGRRAEDLYHDLDSVSRETARQLFLRLVTVSEGDPDTRRRVSVTELHRLGISDEAVASVLDGFGGYRILTFDRDPVTRAPTVQVAHEAILSEWGRFESWIDDHREDLLVHRRLTVAIAEWQDSDESPGYLLSGGRLEHFAAWAADSDMMISSVERDFLEASRTRENEQRAKRGRRRTWILVGFAAAAILALILAVAALYQSSLRASEAAVNHARELSAGAITNLDADPELSTLLALEALSVTPEPQREAVEALHAAVLTSRTEFLLSSPGELPLGDGPAVTTTPDGTAASTGAGDWITLHDGVTGSYVGVLEPDSSSSPDGTPPGPPSIDANPATGDIAAVYGDGVLRVWDPKGATVVWSEETVPGAPVYSPDGRWLAIVTDAEVTVLSVWDAATGERLWNQELTEIFGPVVSFSPSGDELALAWWLGSESGTGQVAVLDRATGAEKRRVDPGVAIGSIAWSPDGTQIFHGTEAGALMGWAADLSELITVRTEHSGSLEDIEFSADGSLLATRSTGGTIKVWATDPLDVTMTLSASDSGESIAFSPDGGRLFAAYNNGTVRAWTTGSEGLGEWMAVAPTGSIFGLDVDASGEYLLAHSVGGRFEPAGATRWQADTGELQYGVDRLTDFSFGGVTYLAAGDRFAAQAASIVAVADSDQTAVSYGPIQIRDAVGGAVLFDLEGSEGFDRQQLSVSPNGRYLASGGTEDQDDGSSASIYDIESGLLSHRLSHPDAFVTGTAFSPDGALLATGSCGPMPGALRIWDWEGEVLQQEVEYPGCVARAAFSPTESIVAVVGYGPAIVWDVDAGHEAYTLAGNLGDAFSIAFSPDGQRIVTAGMDGMLRIWDATDGSGLLAISLSSASLGDVAFFPDGDRVAAASVDGSLWVVTLDTDDLADIAQDRLTRTLTPDECTRYHIESCPET